MSTITGPSGFSFEARKLSADELRQLSEANESNESDGGLTRIINACWEDLVDPGPYQIASGARPNWDRILDGDVVVAIMQMRRATLGEVVQFNFECERCGRKQPSSMDVELSSFAVRTLPETTRAALMANKPLVAQQLDGSEVHFHPMLMGQLKRLTDVKRQYQKKLPAHEQKKAMRAQPWDFLVRQVTHVQKLGDKAADVMERIKWARYMPLDDFFHLQQQFENAECGVDLSVDAVCQHVNCEWEQEDLTLPLRGAFFRMPKREKEPKQTEPESDSALG